MKILEQIFPKAIPKSMFQLTDVCWKSIGGFLKAACILLIRFLKAASYANWRVSVSQT
jgi:hypothetical protein